MGEMEKHPLTKTIAKTYVLHRFLWKYYNKLIEKGYSDKDYYDSLPRRQHGIGGAWMGADNGGSDDCAKERFRRITDTLGLERKTPHKIFFRTSTCKNETNFMFKGKNKQGIHRVEHTAEVANLFKQWELDKIMKNKPFTPNEMGRWVIERQVVVLCEDAEQIRKWKWDSNKPFSKYSASVWNTLDGSDVSNLDYQEIQKLNRKIFQHELDLIDCYNFDDDIQIAQQSFDDSDHHFLPPIDIMVKHHKNTSDNQHWLIENVYKEKLRKISDPKKTGKNGYNPQIVKEHRDWKNRDLGLEIKE